MKQKLFLKSGMSEHWHVRFVRITTKLLPDTISYVASLKSECMWIKDVAEAQEQLRGYRKRLTKESNTKLRELRRRLQLMSQMQPHHVLKEKKVENS